MIGKELIAQRHALLGLDFFVIESMQEERRGRLCIDKSDRLPIRFRVWRRKDSAQLARIRDQERLIARYEIDGQEPLRKVRGERVCG